MRKKQIENSGVATDEEAQIEEAEIIYLAKMMTLFINRAQQKYLGGEVRLGQVAREYLKSEGIGVMSAEEFEAKVRVMTMHRSKGLEAEVVIILEADEGWKGGRNRGGGLVGCGRGEILEKSRKKVLTW